MNKNVCWKHFPGHCLLIAGVCAALPSAQAQPSPNATTLALQSVVVSGSRNEQQRDDLPLSMVLSWYEQKAVVILLTLLSLGIKNIRLGPTLPAFVTPNVLGILVEKFGIKPITTPDEDLKAILG